MLISAKLAAAALAVALLAPLAVAPVRASDNDAAVRVAMTQCAGGYHADRQGNCQPDNEVPDRRCPPGLLATPWPNPEGYRCIPY